MNVGSPSIRRLHIIYLFGIPANTRTCVFVMVMVEQIPRSIFVAVPHAGPGQVTTICRYTSSDTFPVEFLNRTMC